MDENQKKPREILEDKLGELQSRTEAPEEIKEEVFNTLDTMSFFVELADLFTIKFTETNAIIVDNINNQIDSSPPDEDPA